MTTSTEFDLECQALGLACAKANFRLDKKVPPAFKSAFLGYRSQKQKLNYFERKWLSLRLSAVKRGMVLDPQVDALFLERITPSHCPVTLEPLSTEQKPKSTELKSKNNPSVDRLVNEGTYAAGNIGIVSVRVNEAKGEMTFEEVGAIATSGDFHKGLEGVEWMRLATLMYGAWSMAVRGADPYLLPLATYPGPAMFTSESQNVQLLLMRHCRDDVWPQSMNVWLQATMDAGGSTEEFMLFAQKLKTAVGQQDYPPSAWLVPGVFDGFVDWYNECKASISPLIQSLREKYQAGIDHEAIVGRWNVGSRYLS